MISQRSYLPEINMDDLCSMGRHVVRETLALIRADSENGPETAFSTVWLGQEGEDKKKALRIDVNAEDNVARLMKQWRKSRFKELEVYGEERLRNPDLDLQNSESICALADAVDGTDLLERGLFNWCSAFVLFAPFRPKSERILASFVGLPTGETYFARCDRKGAYVVRGKESPVPVYGPSGVEDIRNASICFYGQKLSNLDTITNNGFLKSLSASTSSNTPDQDLSLRVYNLAGIPMMLKLIDHRVKHAHGIDVVFDAIGQKPHDVVPGAFIAKKAGAILLDLDGNEIPDELLEERLNRPAATKLTYIMAATAKLGNTMTLVLKEMKISNPQPIG